MSKGVAGIRFGGAGSNGTVTGTGTTNRFAIWTSSTAIGDSSWENSSGHFRPTTDNTYDVGDSTHYVRALYTNIVDYSSTYILKQAGSEKARFDSSGNFGVNTGATIFARLSCVSSGTTNATNIFGFYSQGGASYFTMGSHGSGIYYSNATNDYAFYLTGNYSSGILFLYAFKNSQILRYSSANGKTGSIFDYYYTSVNNDPIILAQYQHAGNGTASNQYFQKTYYHNTSTTSNVLMAETRVTITDNTHASRKSKYSIYTCDSASPGEYFKVHGKYVMLSTPNAAPTDADLNPASIEFYLDEAGNNLKVRVKYTDGTTLKTGTLAIV